MSLLTEIRKQSLLVRGLMFGLSVITTISLVAIVWFNSFQRDLVALNNKKIDATAQASGAFAFVGQGFSGDINHLVSLIEQAVTHKGFSLVNVFQPCVTFNQQTSYAWYRERIYKLEKDNYDSSDIKKALLRSLEPEEKIPIGIIYKQTRPTYTDSLSQLAETTLVASSLKADITDYLAEFI